MQQIYSRPIVTKMQVIFGPVEFSKIYARKGQKSVKSPILAAIPKIYKERIDRDTSYTM